MYHQLFTDDRLGTMLTPAEREMLIAGITYLEEYRRDIPALQESVRSAQECGLDGWDESLELICIDHDLHFMYLTLNTGIIQMG